MAGRPPKPPTRRQGHRDRAAHREARLNVATGGAIVPLHVPPAPKGVSRTIAAEWAVFWRSEYAASLKWKRDGRAVTRLFELYDLHDRYLRAERRRPLVAGSTGQPIANPLGKRRDTIAAEIRQLEDRFGLNLRTAMQMGVTMTEWQKSLDDLIEDASDDGDHDAIEATAREVR